MTILCTALVAALSAASPGDTITVTGACPASIVISNKNWSPSVTVDASAATLTNVTLNKVSGLALHAGKYFGNNVTRAGVSIQSSSRITVEYGQFDGFTRVAIGVGLSNDIKLYGNLITRSGSDGIDVALSRRVVIDRNTCSDFAMTPLAHPDCIQLWSRPEAAPTADVSITNNYMIGAMQGVSLFNHQRPDATGKIVDDGGFDRVTITGNIIAVSFPDALSLYACRSCSAYGNIIRTLAGAVYIAHVYADRVSVTGLGINDVGILPK